MAIQDIWLANLKDLVEAEGKGNRRRGMRAVADVAGLSEEYIYQLVERKPKANGDPPQLGPDAAAKISKGFREGRDEDWFDIRPERAKTKNATVFNDERMIEYLAAALCAVKEPDRESVSRKLAALALAPDSAQLVAALKTALAPGTTPDGPARVKPEHQEELANLVKQAEARKDHEQKQQRRSVPRR